MRNVVDAIYRPDPEPARYAGREDLVTQLNNGDTVKELVRQIAKSPEHLELIGTGPRTSTVSGAAANTVRPPARQASHQQ
jgi:hypothetical protein